MTRTDRDHLRILAICHYILGALCFLGGAFFGIYLVIGYAIIAEAPAQPAPNGAPPEFIGWFFVGIAVFCMGFYWLLATGLVLAAGYLREQRRRPFCLVVAGFSCLLQPLGLVLGIFTFIVLMRPGVRDAFEPVPSESDEHDEHDTYHSE